MKNILRLLFVVIVSLLAGAIVFAESPDPYDTSGAKQAVTGIIPDFGNTPLYFIKNEGQTSSHVHYHIGRPAGGVTR